MELNRVVNTFSNYLLINIFLFQRKIIHHRQVKMITRKESMMELLVDQRQFIFILHRLVYRMDLLCQKENNLY
jgi:hypothetical protein